LLLAATPVSAAGGKKKGKASDKTEQSASKDGEKDDKKDKSKGKGKGKKADAEAAAEDEAEAEEQQAVAEPDSWEAPPPEDEKPPADKPKPLVDKSFRDPLPFSAALLLGWGFKTDRRTGGLGADPYGLGFGLRGGYVFDFSLYAGAYFIYYLGSTEEGAGTAFGTDVGQVETSANYMHFGLEVGYDAWVGSIMLRPSLQLGAALAVLSRDGVTDSSGDFALNPGITVIHPIDEFFLGADVRGHLVTGDGISALSFFATGGIRFE
jgi:hypothetical protein